MPDLQMVPFYECETATNWQKKIGQHTVTWDRFSHKTNGVQYDFSCTCEGYKYRKACKHIDEARGDFCGWMEFIDGGKPKGNKCPKCGSAVKSRQWGV